MKFVFSFIFTFLFILLSVFSPHTSSFAGTTEGQRLWLGLLTKRKISSSLDLWAEVQLRRDEDQQTMQQIVNRFGLLASLNDHHEVGILLAYIQTHVMKEYRLALQHTYKNSFGKSDFLIRNRFEGRDIENNDHSSLRIRSLLRWSYFLSERFDLVIWDEPFLNLTRESWSGNRSFERNRAFIGTKIKMEQMNFEIGYLNQSIFKNNQKNISEHVAVLYCFF